MCTLLQLPVWVIHDAIKLSFSLSSSLKSIRLTFSLPFAKRIRLERERLPLLTFRFHAASSRRTARFFRPDPARPRGACPLFESRLRESRLRLNNFNIIVHLASVSTLREWSEKYSAPLIAWSALTMKGNKLQKTDGAKREVESSLERMDTGEEEDRSESASGCDEPRRK